jgi:hypothetical protein
MHAGDEALEWIHGGIPRVRLLGIDLAARFSLPVGLCLGLAGPALLLYALSAAEAVRRGQDPGPRLAADLARAGLAEPRIPPRG